MSVSPMSSTRSPSLISNGSAAEEQRESEKKIETARAAAGRRLEEDMASERGWAKNNRAPSLSSAGGAANFEIGPEPDRCRQAIRPRDDGKSRRSSARKSRCDPDRRSESVDRKNQRRPRTRRGVRARRAGVRLRQRQGQRPRNGAA